MDVVQNYLRLVSAYCEALGGLRWSSVEDAIEYKDGDTFVFTEEIALFVEGFAASRPLIHFGFLLHLLDLLQGRQRQVTPEVARLRQAYLSESHRALWNAGAFCGVLCRDLPDFPEAVTLEQVCDRLRSPARPIRWFVAGFHDTFNPAEQLPLKPADFERQVLLAAAAYAEEDLRVWFRHGRGPVRAAAKALAGQLPSAATRTLTGVLETLLQRPRFSGVQPFVAQMVSALALPPRRLAHEEIPIGGYADVTTQGRPDQILPSQFALDELDFFRRFAERELLYFQREEPHTRTRQELVVLLDQGVRTWGDVRLVLSAAVLALGKQADRRGHPFFLATTGNGGELIDPLQVDEETLGQLLDASDLSANPGLALERVLEQSTSSARDVVLLTHPRNLREADVAAAARRLTPAARLFTVALDASGNVQLCELRHGAAVKLRQFKVDFTASRQPPARCDEVAGPAPWRGDIEPIGFPFRFGTDAPPRPALLDFDYAGEWLLTAVGNGMLYAWKVDGSAMEVLPRGMMTGTPLTSLDAVCGVAGGFVVTGKVRNSLVAAHYDFVRRHCTAFVLGDALHRLWRLRYSREHHVVIVFTVPTSQGYAHAVDLATGARFSPGQGGPASRVREAFFALVRESSVPGELCVANSLPLATSHGSQPFLYLDQDSGQIVAQGLEPSWPPFTPLADGQPALKGCLALAAKCWGSTLAVKVNRLGLRGGISLHLFRGPPGVPLASYPLANYASPFLLSRDGRCLCRQTEACRWAVHQVAVPTEPPFLTRKGGFPQRLQIALNNQWLMLGTGERRYAWIRWDRSPLEVRQSRTNPTWQDPDLWVVPGVAGTKAGLPECARYDPERFVLGTTSDLIVVGDRFGQVAILDLQHQLICMVFAFRDQLAIWMPDGTCHGPASLTGRPPTPSALEKIARALQEARQRGRSQP